MKHGPTGSNSKAGLHCRLVPLGASPFAAFCYRAMDVYLRVLSSRGISQNRRIGSVDLALEGTYVK